MNDKSVIDIPFKMKMIEDTSPKKLVGWSVYEEVGIGIINIDTLRKFSKKKYNKRICVVA